MITNKEFELAEQFALQTGQSFFLTGKAGSGKTTLLKHIAEKTSKNFVIVAPTGVAAINAGGVTIHSMFLLPTTAFVPSYDFIDMNLVTNRRLLLSHLRYSKEKRRLLQEMELLIIDEISMVRCDILDAVDFALQTIRRNTEPFGGVQVMLIGDMHQLPPVTKEAEWTLLQNYYQSPYFFDSLVWKKLDAVEIELKKIYRQQDEIFLRILNNIRNKELEEEDFLQLEKRYNPHFQPTEPGYILLSTHNHKAESVNQSELKRLPEKLYYFEAEIEGDFPENMFPCEPVLYLKEGAQVMFIKNDTEHGKYYNGKLATIKELEEDKIIVRFNDSNESVSINRQAWENIRYSLDESTGSFIKKELGSFSQYPLRLAWAVTIHKSQGLTFDKVIIDAGQSFAAGQVYVALSRCRTLEGIVLHSRITQNALFADDKINSFSSSHHREYELENILVEAKRRYARLQLKKLFSFHKFPERLQEWKDLLESKDIPEKETAIVLNSEIMSNLSELILTADKFQHQLDQLTSDSEAESGHHILKERCSKAIDYFTTEFFNRLISPLHEHIQSLAYKSRVKKYVQFIQGLEDSFWNKSSQLYQAYFSDEKLFTGQIKFSKQSLKKVSSSITSGKKEKGGTFNDTLLLYKEGKNIEEIAEMRSLTKGTIKSHLAKWIKLGQVNIESVLPAGQITVLKKLIQKYGADNYPAIRSELGTDFDYGDLRMVINSMGAEEKK